ncbi:MAG: hypothetical protein ACFB21_02570 [Opitutales bacterium]
MKNYVISGSVDLGPGLGADDGGAIEIQRFMSDSGAVSAAANLARRGDRVALVFPHDNPDPALEAYAQRQLRESAPAERFRIVRLPEQSPTTFLREALADWLSTPRN